MSAGRSPGARRQRGVAILTAMLVVTVATLLAVELAWETNLDLRRTEGIISREQAMQFGYGAEAFAAKLLEEKLQGESGGTTVYSRSDDETACRGFQFTIEQGGMTGGVCDLQGRFNLNNLVVGVKRDELAIQQLRRLILAVSTIEPDLDIDPQLAEVIAESAADWIDADGTAEFNGAEDDEYTSQQPPYRAANFWFTSVSELRAVRGVTPEIYIALAPYVAALPVVGGQRTLINVNTASVPVLMSLGDNVALSNAEIWVADSARDPFEDATPFAGLVDQAMIPYIGFSSAYFELRGLVSIGTTRLGMYSLLESTGQSVVPRLRQFDVVEAAVVTDAAQAVEGEKVIDSDE